MIEALPQYVLPGTRPMPVTRAAARRIIAAFDATGGSQHSGAGATLWVLIEHCETKKINYDIHFYGSPCTGIFINQRKAEVQKK